jgi:hypothetical protein
MTASSPTSAAKGQPAAIVPATTQTPKAIIPAEVKNEITVSMIGRLSSEREAAHQSDRAQSFSLRFQRIYRRTGDVYLFGKLLPFFRDLQPVRLIGRGARLQRPLTAIVRILAVSLGRIHFPLAFCHTFPAIRLALYSGSVAYR